VLIYDRYDIWAIDPATGKATNFTNGMGRRYKIEFRYDSNDPKEKFIPSKKTLWMIAQNDENKQWGYYKKELNSDYAPKKGGNVTNGLQRFAKSQKCECIYLHQIQLYPIA
jgi:hypothetical protein